MPHFFLYLRSLKGLSKKDAIDWVPKTSKPASRRKSLPLIMSNPNFQPFPMLLYRRRLSGARNSPPSLGLLLSEFGCRLPSKFIIKFQWKITAC